MTDYSERIPAAIAKGKEKLEGYEIVVVPPHTGGNDTRLTVGLTAGEVALADLGWKNWQSWNAMRHRSDSPLPGNEPIPAELIAYCEKIERLSHD